MKHFTSMAALFMSIALILVPAFVLSEQAAPVELPAPELCEACGKEHVLLPCGDHAICNAEITGTDYAGHQLAECGSHYTCEETCQSQPERHNTRGKACQEYMCHKINADYHTRCKHCGGALCYNRHGRGICYDFGYNYVVDQLNKGGGEKSPQATPVPTTGEYGTVTSDSSNKLFH